MVKTILESKEGSIGMAYLYPMNSDGAEVYVLRMTAYNVTNFLGAHQFDVKKIILTDIYDRLILDTAGGFIMNCPDQAFCQEVVKILAPIQMGMAEAKEIAVVMEETFCEYCG